jgi:hypothetical protein
MTRSDDRWPEIEKEGIRGIVARFLSTSSQTLAPRLCKAAVPCMLIADGLHRSGTSELDMSGTQQFDC